ncbi:multisubunit sodium/proton antiporter, MrpB subunit [Desulfocurvibacter africanus PCS]|uniref:Multisubunit sodium/proton antiporter, MrpB subunit n=1 Tax=Desulfocurvibacter africanus PCS TaxID=1262666 RepID=M5PQE1_DESAF|nr:hydrogen gas-evolving membrane-bound hydrogenase subunit E [Desulfocurvibacter africanus]EMG36542.1 multisubunit sodium/proton antiporter, MrpB subunit [Desulfocurvibacter africanus PCS]
MKAISLIAVLLAGLALVYTTSDFPAWGDPESPASLHVSNLYIEQSYEKTHTPNVVTSVLADYRGFDTMFETIVVFTAAMACFFILRRSREECVLEHYYYRHIATGLVVRMPGACATPTQGAFEQIDSDWTPQDIVVSTVCRLLIPFMQIFGLYVLAHGHYSPGGGFQAGVILAASYLLLALSHDLRFVIARFSERLMHILAAAGVTIYVGTGFIALTTGANFLDYGGLAGLLRMPLASGHSLGILLVETGVALTVCSALIMIFKLVSSQGTINEGL